MHSEEPAPPTPTTAGMSLPGPHRGTLQVNPLHSHRTPSALREAAQPLASAPALATPDHFQPVKGTCSLCSLAN